MDVTLTSVEDAGNDVLLIKAVVGDQEVEARGWASAITNHYDASANDAKGQRKPNQKPRAMTAAEVKAYCEQRIREANGILPDPVKVDGVVDEAAAAAALERIQTKVVDDAAVPAELVR